MKNLTPVPVSNAGLQLLSPMDQNGAPPPPKKFQLQKLLYFLKKFWWIPAITLTLSMLAAAVVFFKTPPIFVSYGALYETVRLRLPDGAAFSDDQNYVGTMIEVITSKKMQQLTLNWLRANSTNNIILGEDGEPLDVKITVYPSPRSSVYGIEARSANPAYTPIYLNALMKQYLEDRRNVRLNVSRETLSSISEQVQKVEGDLKSSQTALQEYERSNNFAVLQQESTVEAGYLAKLKTELSDYQLQIRLLDAMEENRQSNSEAGTNFASDTLFTPLPGGPGNNGSSSYTSGREDAVRQIKLLQLERERLSKYLRPLHPKIVKLDEEIARSQKLVDVYSRQNIEQIAAARHVLELKVTNTLEFISQWETKIAEHTTRLASANSLKEAVARNQALFDRLDSMLQNVDISRNIDQDTLTILEYASPATRSYKESSSMAMKYGFIGLAIGLGIIFLLFLRDDQFASMVEVTESFGDNVVGQIPDMLELEMPADPLLALLQSEDDRHMFAESYRNLRSALLYLTVDGHSPRMLLISSAVPNEGKSTVATNLARALALGGSKVLLIDADLRKGHIHDRLKLESKPGLSDWLRRPGESRPLLQSTDLENLTFLARGSISHNPGDLFLKPAFDALLTEFRRQFEYVVIDSSPVFAADDSSTLAPKVDGTLFVVRSRFSNARAVREALNLLFQRQARVLGLILNRANTKARSYYAYKYAQYYAHAGDAEHDEKG